MNLLISRVDMIALSIQVGCTKTSNLYQTPLTKWLESGEQFVRMKWSPL